MPFLNIAAGWHRIADKGNEGGQDIRTMSFWSRMNRLEAQGISCRMLDRKTRSQVIPWYSAVQFAHQYLICNAILHGKVCFPPPPDNQFWGTWWNGFGGVVGSVKGNSGKGALQIKWKAQLELPSVTLLRTRLESSAGYSGKYGNVDGLSESAQDHRIQRHV